ncbi:hypothetical protein D9M70_482050 [compost metagenome]
MSSTRIGRRPCSSGTRSLGLDRWNAPEAMNRMWSVFTMPSLVFTVQPSISGSRSRCTPSRETSAPPALARLAILSISSRKTMPFCSTASRARPLRSSSLTRRCASSSRISFIASATFSLRVLRLPLPMLENRFCNWLVISSMPGGAMISTPAGTSATSMSISLSSSWPSRRRLRNSWRVLESSRCAGSSPKPPVRAGGSRASRMRSSAASSARYFTFWISCSRSILIAASARSRTMDSTSRPT